MRIWRLENPRPLLVSSVANTIAGGFNFINFSIARPVFFLIRLANSCSSFRSCLTLPWRFHSMIPASLATASTRSDSGTSRIRMTLRFIVIEAIQRSFAAVKVRRRKHTLLLGCVATTYTTMHHARLMMMLWWWWDDSSSSSRSKQ